MIGGFFLAHIRIAIIIIIIIYHFSSFRRSIISLLVSSQIFFKHFLTRFSLGQFFSFGLAGWLDVTAEPLRLVVGPELDPVVQDRPVQSGELVALHRAPEIFRRQDQEVAHGVQRVKERIHRRHLELGYALAVVLDVADHGHDSGTAVRELLEVIVDDAVESDPQLHEDDLDVVPVHGLLDLVHLVIDELDDPRAGRRGRDQRRHARVRVEVRLLLLLVQDCPHPADECAQCPVQPGVKLVLQTLHLRLLPLEAVAVFGRGDDEGENAVGKLLLEQVCDGVRLAEGVEEIELRDGLALGQGNALESNLDGVVYVLVEQVADENAHDLHGVGGQIFGAGEHLAPFKGDLGQLEDVDGRLLAEERLAAVRDGRVDVDVRFGRDEAVEVAFQVLELGRSARDRLLLVAF